ncbi:MAG: glyceraldehyde-3-phosphate dehydrogenase [Pseudomonadota bacterium]
MSNRAGWVVFALIVGTLAVVFLTVDGAALFTARKFADLVNWMAFWR